MSERRGTKALELWCRRITDGYPGVNVQNMTTSWRDGLAFCAMIHHFRPDLIDFDSLNKDDVYGNNELAFRTAAEHLGIPALLDAEDMASCSVPDRLSILTYLSQFYQSFGGSSPSRLALSRTKESSNEGITPVPESTTPKVGPRAGMRRDPCAVCGMPVFLAEKLVISRTPYHRTCFRCARCKNQLTPGNYYETEDGQYCCETCPDEEDSKSPSTGADPFYRDESSPRSMLIERDESTRADSLEPEVYKKSLSDEEKTVRRAQLTGDITKREISTRNNSSGDLRKYSQTAQMRLNFMTNHLLAANEAENLEKLSLNDGDATTTTTTTTTESAKIRSIDSSSLRRDEIAEENNRREPKGTPTPRRVAVERVDVPEEMPSQGRTDSPLRIKENLVISDFRDSNDRAPVASEANIRSDTVTLGYNKDEELKTRRERYDGAYGVATSPGTKNRYARLEHNEENTTRREDTKDKIGPDIDAVKRKKRIEDEKTLSLVQRRLRMFERQKLEDITREETPLVSSSTSLQETNDNDDEEEQDTRDTSNDLGNEDERAKTGYAGEVAPIPVNEETPSVQDDLVPTSKENTSKGNEILLPPVPKRKARRDDELKVNKSAEVTVLNASGIDLSDDENYPKDLNPFGSDEDKPLVTRRTDDEPHEQSQYNRVSTNPFGSSGEDEESGPIVLPPRPATRNISRSAEITRHENSENEAPTKRRLKAPRINLNPFWSDDDEDRESEEEPQDRDSTANTPVPKPRTIRETTDTSLSPWKNDLNRSGIYASNSSLASTGSTSTPGGTYRKKKPAPPPPIVKELFTSGGDSLPSSVDALTASNNSLRAISRSRKAKAAPPPPPPPVPTSTPCSTNLTSNMTLAESPIIDSDKIIEPADYEVWKQEAKNDKDEANRSKQSMTTSSCDDETMSSYDVYADKSSHGKWKRKKGPAPARPIPHRRKIKVMSLKDVKLELDEIEMQQQGLEKQGVRLEQLIRDKAETGNATEGTSLGLDVEELVLELFALVNEKNELFRRQAELMLLRRQQRLEEEHADIEYQIRCLLCQPEATKTDFDKQREETLIQRLVEIVERRNEIVECLEMDRRREVEEDRSINTQMGIYAAKNKADFVKELEDEESNRLRKSKKTKLKEKAKEKILRKVHKKDADKDVDETEVKLKRQNKKKWF